MTDRVGRRVTTRIRARGWLRTESPLHVGGLGHDPSEPLPIAVDGLGRLYVPGTSLAGALRGWSRGADPETTALDRLWGTAPGDDEAGGASRVIVADGLITAEPVLDGRGLPAAPLDPGLLEFRPSVGIDRSTGTAAPEFLYGRAVVPAGCHLRLEIDIEADEDAAIDEARMAALLDALANEEVRLGAATSRGFGAVRLLDHPFELVVDRFDSPEGLLATLRNDPARVRTLASLRGDADLPRAREKLDIRISWTPRAPVMVRSGTRGLIVDTLPLTTRIGRRHLTLVLPGGSIKGALRAHAELVERTARGIDLSAANGPAGAHSAAFRAQLDQLPAVRALFGAARDDDATRRAGALRAEECTSTATVSEDLWRSVTGADTEPSKVGENAELLGSVRDRLDDLGMAQADHVALDRWTGGAADGRLFSVIEPHAVEWEPIRLSVDLDRIAPERDAPLALLLLTLRDLVEGRIQLGAAANRGFGDVKVNDITLTGGPWTGPVSLRQALEGPEIAPIAAAWTSYLDSEIS